MLPIDRDLGRFREILKGRVRRELKKLVSNSDLVGRKGKNLVTIPIPSIGIPRLRHGQNPPQGVGQGPGGGTSPGEEAGDHPLEVEMDLEELARMLGDELELPRIMPRGEAEAPTVRNATKGISRQGPQALRHMRRTWKQALRRQVASGTFDPARPVLVPVRDDQRYRSFVPEKVPHSAAAVLYLMDVSGSMGRDQKEIVRTQAFWIDTWLSHNYREVRTRFIVHDAVAREVDRDTFFRLKESGGTLISSAYELALSTVRADYPADRFNTYVFHFSDGDNWSSADTKKCVDLLRDELVPLLNQFAYAQVDSPYGSGQFLKDLVAAFGQDERVATARVADRDAILDAIRALLGRGR